MNRAEELILGRISNDDKSALDLLYKEYRAPFYNYFKRYSISDEEIEDLYQDTMIAFYQNGVRGKLGSLRSSIKTYVFGIGKNKAIDLIRNHAKTKELPTEDNKYEVVELEGEELTNEQRKLKKYFVELGESCKKMLTMFYYRGLSIQDIVELGSYKDANSVKSHKSRCLKQLRTLTKK